MRPRVRPWTKYFNIVTVWQSSKVALAFSKKVPLAGYSVFDYQREGQNSNGQNVHFGVSKFYFADIASAFYVFLFRLLLS